MSTLEIVLLLIASHVGAFVFGALWYRANQKKGSKIADTGDTVIKDVTNAAKKL